MKIISRFLFVVVCLLSSTNLLFSAITPPTTNSPGSSSSPGTVVNTLTPTFSWNAASGATGYGLYIRDMTASGTPLVYPNSSGTTSTPLTGTSFTIPSGYLVSGHDYRWDMSSFSGSTESTTYSAILYFQDVVTVPVSPPTTNSPGSSSSPGTVVNTLTPTFSWNAASGATGYGLYIRDMTASGTPLVYPNSSGTTSTPLTGTSFTIPSGYLVSGHDYRWDMSSFSGSTESTTYSAILYFQDVVTVPVSPPTTNSPGSSSSPGTVVNTLTPTFSWNAASGATGYGLYIRDMTASGTPLVYPNSSGTTSTPLTGTSFTIPSGYLVSGHDYRWDMSSFSGSTESTTYSAILYFQDVVTVPVSPPTINSPGSSSSPGTVVNTLTPTFSWNAASGATGYGLYIRDMTASGTPLVYPNSSGTTSTPLTGTSFTIPSGYLVSGHDYRWDMSSFSGSTESTTYSAILYFQDVVTVPVSPPTTNSPGSSSSPGTVVNTLTPTFSWNAASGATGYGLYIRDMTASGTPLVYPNSSGTTSTPLTGTSFTIPSGYLVSGHDYRWDMSSFSGSTESTTYSAILYFQDVVTVPVSPPTTNSPGSSSSPGTVVNTLTPTFSWNAASGATGYGLYIRDMTASGTPLVYPNSSGTTSTPLTGTSFTIPSGYLVSGHDYRWDMSSFSGSTESTTYSAILYFQTTDTMKTLPLGIDVSEFQNAINWGQVSGIGGKVFAIIRASAGAKTTDAYFAQNVVNAKDSGLIVGAYHFAYPQYYTADQEAQKFLSVARDLVEK